MRVAFVEDILRFSVPLGITSVAAMLRKGGHDVQVFVMTGDFERVFSRLAASRGA
jgi:hypothetical protein